MDASSDANSQTEPPSKNVKTTPSSPRKKKPKSPRKKVSNPKKKSHKKSQTSPSKPKKKKRRKARKRKNNINKPAKIVIKDSPKNTNNTQNSDTPTDQSILNGTDMDTTANDINLLQTTFTSPIQSFNTLAQENAFIDVSINWETEMKESDLNKIIPHSPLEAIKQHKLKKINEKKTRKNKSKKSSEIGIDLSYFQNYMDKNVNIPTEINTVLDRIENGLQFIFTDAFLSKSVRTKKIFNLSVSLHSAMIEYKLHFLLPICKIKLTELDAMLVQIIKYFNRFKRYHRSQQMSKYKAQITKLKNNCDILIDNIESHSSLILYSLIRAKQLFLEFHRNSKLLIFWMDLFEVSELEYVELSWVDFVSNVRQNKQFIKFKKFKNEDMINVLTDNYEVLTIREFLKYVLEYESVGGWLNDMYSYIAAEIANPHKKGKNKLDLSKFSDSINEMIKETIQREMSEKFSELTTQFQEMIKGKMDSDSDELPDIAAFEPITSNGTMIMNHGSTNSNASLSEISDKSDDERIKNLESEMESLRRENTEYKAKVDEYEMRLNGVTMKSKQIFSLQTKVNYYEKLASVLKKQCLSLHKQLNTDVTQMSIWHNSKTNNNDSNSEELIQIQSLFDAYLSENEIDRNSEQITEIQKLFKNVLEQSNESMKFNQKSSVMWQRMSNALQNGTTEILSIYKQIKDNFITNDSETMSVSPLSPTLPRWNRSQSDKVMLRRQRSPNKKTHKQKTFSVATLKEMNRNSNSKNIKNRQRTYSNHDLDKLKFVPLTHDSFDLYTNKAKKNKRVSFGMERIKVDIGSPMSDTPNSNSPQISFTNNKASKHSRKRRYSDSNVMQINKGKLSTVSPIHKLFEGESKLNSDTINKIRNELLKEQKINKVLQRRHSLCSVTDTAMANNEQKRERIEILTEKPINYNNFTTRMRATSAGNRTPLMGLYDNNEYSDDDLNRIKQTHFRNSTLLQMSSRSNRTSVLSKFAQKKRKHKKYKTMQNIHGLNPGFLSPNWAANVALKTVSDGMNAFDDSASDVISTLSNVDYTFLLDDYELNDTLSNEESFVNIYGNESEDIQSLHDRRRSYRFPNESRFRNDKKSMTDPFDLLNDEILYNEKEMSKSEGEMKQKLTAMLREMDLMGEGRLDLADFTSAIMNVVRNYDDIMEDAELLFDGLSDAQDEMGSVKIETIVDCIVFAERNQDCVCANNIKKEIVVGMKLDNDNESDDTEGNDENVNSNSNTTLEDMPALNVKPKEIDPNAQPYKPMYYTTSALQKI